MFTINELLQYDIVFKVLERLNILFVFPSVNSFTTIHESQDCRGRRRAFL